MLYNQLTGENDKASEADRNSIKKMSRERKDLYCDIFRELYVDFKSSDDYAVQEGAAYAGEKYICGKSDLWEDKTFVESVGRAIKTFNKNKLGSKAADVRLRDISGASVNLYDIQKDYKVLYIYNPTCEMLVDGHVRRICITKVDGVKKVERIGDANSKPANGDMFRFAQSDDRQAAKQKKIHKTTVAIIGAGPAGLAVREALNKAGVDNLVIDNNSKIGGQFKMQTHQFFFFEKEKKFGGMHVARYGLKKLLPPHLVLRNNNKYYQLLHLRHYHNRQN